MGSIYGENIHLSIFGQSHSPAIGMSLDGLPAGREVDLEELAAFLARRAPGRNAYSTKRREADLPEILGGLVDGKTCGAPFAAIIRNTNTRSGDYDNLREVPRPGHADYTAQQKFGGAQDVAGGGHFSGRMTAPLCIAGGVCRQLLAQEGIFVGAHIASVAGVRDWALDPVRVGRAELSALEAKEFPVLSDERGAVMRDAIEQARLENDSVGGVIECAVVGAPAGLGDPMFLGMENRLAAILFGIPAVKGLEFGNGFACADLRGSENNDAFCVRDGQIQTETNRHGGILGGITSGMPILFRVVCKPTPSIGRPQQSVQMREGTETTLQIHGRHDPCIVPRAVPCVEAAAAIAVYDAFLSYKKER